MLKGISFICKYALVRFFCPEMSRYWCLNTATKSAWWQWYHKQGGTTLELNLKPLKPHMFPICAISVRAPGCDPAISACCFFSTPASQMHCLKARETLEEWSCCLYATHLACPAPPGPAESKSGRGIQQPATKQVHTECGSPHAFNELFSLLGFFNQWHKLNTTTVQQSRKKAGEERGATWAGWLCKWQKKMRRRRRWRLQLMLRCWIRNEEQQRRENLNTPTLIPSPCGVRELQIKKGERCLERSQGALP